MSLRIKFYLLIGFLILGSVSVVYLSSVFAIGGGFDELEHQMTPARVERATSALKDQLLTLELTTNDYAHWDEAYAFAHGNNDTYIGQNMQPSSLHRLRISAAIVTDAKSKLLAAVASNPDGRTVLPSQELMERLESLGLMSVKQGQSGTLKGIMGVGSKVFLAASVPIKHTDGSGPVAGRLVYVREANEQLVKQLNASTTLNIDLASLKTATNSSKLAPVLNRLLNGEHAICELTDSDTAKGYGLLLDPTGRPAAIIITTIQRDAYAQAMRGSSYLMLITTAFVLLFAIVALGVWNRTVFSRLTELGKGISAAGSGDSIATIHCDGKDEIAAIARVFNSTLHRLQESQGRQRRERERLEVTLASIGDAVIATDAQDRITFINRMAQTMTGWTAKEAAGRYVWDVMVLVDEETEASAGEATLLVSRDGTEIPVDTSTSPIKAEDGKPAGSVIVFRDVTERREAHAKIRESESRLKTIWQSIHTGVVIVDAETHAIVDVNDVAAGMIGRRKHEILGKACHGFLCPSEGGHCPIPENVSIMECGESMMRTASGDMVEVLKTMARVKLDGRPHIIETFADISDRKRAEEALTETSDELERLLARNKAILETSAVGVMVTSGDRRITEANRRMAETYGCQVDELIGTDPATMFPSEEAFRTFADTAGPALLSGQDVVIEQQMKRADGTLAWWALSGNAIDPQDLAKGTVWMVIDITERMNATEALKTTQFAMDHASDSVYWIDSEARFQYVNEAAVASLGYSREELLQMRVFDIDPEFPEEKWAEHWKKISETGHSSITTTHRTKDGRTFPVELCTNYHEFGDTKQIITFARDITKRVQDEAQMRLQVSAINAAGDPVLILDRNGNVVFANKAIEAQSGYDWDELVGRNPVVLLKDREDAKTFSVIWKTISSGHTWSGEMLNQKKSGEPYYSESTVTPVMDASGQPEYYIAISRDITDRKSHERMLDRQAKHDTLTGLPNRLVFNETLSAMVSGHRKSEAMLAVMFIDLDRFKSVNDTLGHDAGDMLLVETSKRLRKCLRDTDMLCRVGGDEFTIILRQISRIEDAQIVADRILTDMNRPFVIKDHEFVVGASIGVSIYPRDASNFTDLVKTADTAMYRAKELGRNNCQFYCTKMDAENTHRLKTEHELRVALRNGELEVYYQPRVDPMTAELVSAESLLRWNHPERGLLPASEFIPLAEETGMILAIGEYVLTAVCAQQQKWIAEGRPPVQIAVNLSEKHAFRTEFLSGISRTMANYGLPPTSLSLELPGKAFLYISEQALQIIQELRETGVQFTLDDFSTGPLPLTILSKIAVDSLKINSSLIASSDAGVDAGMVASIAATARNLGLQVVAVGVETRQHLELAGSMMCDAVQGYLVSQPLPLKAFERYMDMETHVELFQGEAA